MTSENEYETLEKIGHGSFGIIRKVRRKADGLVMCRKEISYLRMSQKEREQLHAEFQILSHLRHTNIVAYYHREHLKQSQDLHLYMEYCGNGDLGRVIKDLSDTKKYAQESFVWSIFSQLVLALYRCHYGIDPPDVGANSLGLTQGNAPARPNIPAGTMTILHRDLKPENVFLGEDNSVKLGDFGLSKMIKSHDFASTYVGTPFYMSPEICAAEKYTLKSDIWSLGCIIYELCAREPPFNAKTHFQLVQKIKEGKVAKLPPVYSDDLFQVIKDCLMVNPDKRPDTTQLLNLPRVKLMRKEKEVVDFNKTLKAKEADLRRRIKEVDERLANADKDAEIIRQELEASVRREWEVKARLEIDRLVSIEVEQLQKRFEEEVKSRVEAELAAKSKKRASFTPVTEPPIDDVLSSSLARLDIPHSSVGATSGDECASGTDITDYSLDSPDTSREIKKKDTRTPFGRAQTMFVGNAGTPMDVEMGSPSPMAIASLSLSPRRTGATKAPSSHAGNIFAANAAANAGSPEGNKWSAQEPHLVDSDDDDILPSPTRQIRSSKNPFTSKTRPVLTSQKSCPVNRLRTQGSMNVIGSNAKAASTLPQKPRSMSPKRRLSKIPSASTIPADDDSSSDTPSAAANTTPSLSGKPFGKKEDANALPKMAAKNNIKGRTLVELQQARAGGRPLSAVVSAPAPIGNENLNLSPKRAPFRERVVMSGERRSSREQLPPAIWDPECDEMPSPFLARRQRAIAKV